MKDHPAHDYFLIYGDIMFDMDIDRFVSYHRNNDSRITLVMHPNMHPQDSDLLEVDEDGRVKSFLWKTEPRDDWYSNLVNAGIFLFRHDILKEIEKPERVNWEKDIINKIVAEGRVFGYRTSEYVKDIGTPDRFRLAEADQSKRRWERRNLKNKQRCIFLDRDGTINHFVGIVHTDAQLELYNDVTEAIRLINASDFLAIIVTNQPAVARGLCSEDDIRYIHKKLETLLGSEGVYLDDIIFCPHHPDKGYPEENSAYKIVCDCRKPKIGMIDRMAEKYNIDPAHSWVIGDSTIDVQLAKNSGMHSVLVHTGEAGSDRKFNVKADFEAADLLEAVKLILKKG